MDKVTDISLSRLEKSKYMDPIRMNYSQNGVAKVWDLSIGHPSVAVVIFNVTRKKLVLVKQLRPAVLLTDIMQTCPYQIDQIDDVNKYLKGMTAFLQ